MMPFIHIGPITLASYGTMILIGMICGAFLIWLRSRYKKYSFQDALFAFFYGMIGVIVGAKLFYLVQALPEIISHWDVIMAEPELLLGILTAGFVFYGGLFGGIAGVFIYAKQFKISFRALIELLIPAVPLIHAFGRIGCFLAGCCYGIPCDGPFCVVFEHTDFAPLNIPLFPVQLLESLLLFLLTGFLLLYDARAKKTRSLVGWYLLLYGIIRMVTEMFRGDLIRGSFLFFSTSQWVSIVLIVVAIMLLIKLPPDRRSKE